MRAGRIKLPEVRKRFVLARGAMRGILGRYLRCAPAGIEFRYGTLGKPEIARPGGELTFNLSHSTDLGLFALAKGVPLGIDLEPIKARANARGIISRVFDPTTAAELLALPEDLLTAAFLRQWTRHEARVKAVGKGVLGQADATIDAISFEPLPGWIAALGAQGAVLSPESWQTFDFRVEDFIPQ